MQITRHGRATGNQPRHRSAEGDDNDGDDDLSRNIRYFLNTVFGQQVSLGGEFPSNFSSMRTPLFLTQSNLSFKKLYSARSRKILNKRSIRIRNFPNA